MKITVERTSTRREKINIKFKNKLLLLAVTIGMAVGLTVPSTVALAAEPVIKVEQQLITGLPKTYATNEFIIAHESGNPSNTGADSLYREVSYMSRNWYNAFVTHWVGAGGKVIQIAPSGYISWGAGSRANYRSYAQVELARTSNKATFKKDYEAYVTLLRKLAKESNIPIKFDAAGKGIKSHEWISYNLGGTDHRDPFAYLNSMGISKAQFKKDIENGLTSTVSKPVPPVKPSVTTYKVGDSVKVTTALYRDSGGNGKSTAMKGYTGKIKRIYGKNKMYLVENWGWAGATDIAKATTNAPSKPAAVPANRWISKKGTATITTPSGIVLRGSGKTDTTAPIKLPQLAVLGRGQAVSYDKILVQKNGYVWVRQPRSTGYGWLPVAQTVNGKVTGGYWVSGVSI